MITYIFPGQGSQQKGMGKGLFQEFPDIVSMADSILGYSIEELCLEDPKNQLGLTQFTQPALFIVNALTYLKKFQDTGITPDYVAGHSLGEYNALFAANAFDLETGLRLVQKRGQLMAQAHGGGMAAIIGLSGEEVKDILEEENLSQIDIANYNTPTQTVIAGLRDAVDGAKDIFESKEKVKLCVMLNVSGAFHSRYMEEAAREFERYIDQQTFTEMKIPVISNVYGREYKQENIKHYLTEQMTHSVQWTDSIRYLMGRGEMTFEEIGSGRVLTGLVNHILKEAEPLYVHEEEVSEIPIQDEASSQDIKILQLADMNTDPSSLGSQAFKEDYKLKYAYIAGAMYRGVSSKELVVKMGQSGMMGFLGTGGMDLSEVETAIMYIQKELVEGQAYGLNFLHHPNNPEYEEQLVDLLLKHNVKTIEVSAFLGITPSLIRYKVKGLKKDAHGKVISENRIIAKISRPEVAEAFLSPAPERLVNKLLKENLITEEEAGLLKKVSIANDICIEADSGGHTDCGVAYTLFPAILKLRNDMMKKYEYDKKVHVGMAGGIGTPEAAAASFLLGADFIVTGSINQCTLEAGTSDVVKDMLQNINVQDTEYAPAGDMFEYGARIQVMKKGTFFPARANKLYDLYRLNNSLEDIDGKTKNQIQEKYFKRSFDSIYEELKRFYPAHVIKKANDNPKNKMALIFKWYFYYSSIMALQGNTERKVDFQVHCGPALGAFNQWVKGTELEQWKNRHVDEIGLKLLSATAKYLNDSMRLLMEPTTKNNPTLSAG